MTPDALKDYLYERIPLARAMEVGVHSVGPESLVLQAPLEPNLNHRGTLFGGSASTICILAAWSLLHLRLKEMGIDCRIVIQRNSMEYTAPVTGAFQARAFFEDGVDWPTFEEKLARYGRARISVEAILEGDGKQAGRLHGEFVALLRE